MQDIIIKIELTKIERQTMEWTGERYVPTLAGEIACEHMNRYYFVINQFDLSHKTVLDIASGEGYGTDILAQHAECVYGVDISEEAIEFAKQKYKRENIVFRVGEATSIPLPANSVDLVVSFETIEHLDAHKDMIDEIKRVMKKDGILIISSPDKLNFTDKTENENHFHIKELYYEEFKQLINENFTKSFFFSQRIFVGSMIALDGESDAYHKPIIINKQGQKSTLEPKYNIAIATNSSELNLPYSIINYSENNKLIIPEELSHANYEGQLLINKTLSYRLGSSIIRPFKIMKNMLNAFL
ncbi:hypothetical protein GCM10028805_60970 [Spirosoma harenae]